MTLYQLLISLGFNEIRHVGLLKR